MKHLRAVLESFNAKERFWLIAAATGHAGLSDDFRRELGGAIGVDVPSSAWWAIDYHLDWVEAALLSVDAQVGDVFSEPEVGRNLNRNQQDVDMIIAWDVGDVTQVAFVEAKGVTSWGNDQYAAKLERLVGLFGVDARGYAGIKPVFVLASPSRPQKLALSGTPAWALDKSGRPNWIRLDVPNNLRRPERCDADGKPLKAGKFWHVVPRKVPGTAGGGNTAPSASE